MTTSTEFVVEQTALAWLERLGWTVNRGPDIAPGELAVERSDNAQLALNERLRQALARLNPTPLPEALEDAFRKLTRYEGATLKARNRALHRLLVDGVTVEHRRPDGSTARRYGRGPPCERSDRSIPWRGGRLRGPGRRGSG